MPHDKYKSFTTQNSRLEIDGEFIGRSSIKFNSSDLPELEQGLQILFDKALEFDRDKCFEGLA
jgi:hypothetical protein